MEIFLFLFLLILLLPALLLLRQAKSPSQETVLKAYPIIGNLPQFLRNRHRMLEWQTDLLAAAPTNSIELRRLGGLRGVLTANPANVEHILKSRFENFPKGPPNISHLEDFLGKGIFNSDGEIWRIQRKIASFEFSTKSLRNFAFEVVREEISSRLIPLLRRAEGVGEVDLQEILEKFAFDNVCQISFGEDPASLEGGTSTFAAVFRDAATISGERFRYAMPKFWKIKRILNFGSEKRLRESIAAVDNFAYKIIKSRKNDENSSAREDLLSRFMNTENNSDISDKFLRDVIISFILAGRETTSSALSWFFWILSGRPDVEEKILEEVRSVRARSNKEKHHLLSFEELKEMNYLQAALSEAMRLYPPVPVNIVYVDSDDVLPDGTELKKGGFVAFSSYAMGRMRAVWGEDCYQFKPERWLGPEGEFRPENPFKYPIFHAGPRACLGKEMAYIQMKSVAAALIENFRVEVVGDGRRPEILLALTLKMKSGLPVIIRGRAQA